MVGVCIGSACHSAMVTMHYSDHVHSVHAYHGDHATTLGW